LAIPVVVHDLNVSNWIQINTESYIDESVVLQEVSIFNEVID